MMYRGKQYKDIKSHLVPTYTDPNVKQDSTFNIDYFRFLNIWIHPIIAPAVYKKFEKSFQNCIDALWIKNIEMYNISIIKADMLLSGIINEDIYLDEIDVDTSDEESDFCESTMSAVDFKRDQSVAQLTISEAISEAIENSINKSLSVNSFIGSVNSSSSRQSSEFVIVDNQSEWSIESESMSSVDFDQI